MDELEVMPVSWKVVCLNAPHLKSLCVFEALSRTLGCYYNHHRPQIVWCHGKVRLPVPRITRIRGHTTHTHPPGEAPALHTLLQMGTYMVFHLSDWTLVQNCQLVLNGIEKIPRSDVPSKVILERVDTTTMTLRPPLPQSENKTKLSGSHTTREDLPNSHLNTNTKRTTLIPVSERVSCAIRSLGLDSNEDSKDMYSKIRHNNDESEENNRVTDKGQQQQPQEILNTHITINMNESEEVTTLLDDEEDDEFSSDTSDDLHKVVRRRLYVDITALLEPPPPEQVLVLLLRPTEETQAWQFLSSCIKVQQMSNKGLAVNGSGTMKRTLTRTKPVYFSKNGNAHRL